MFRKYAGQRRTKHLLHMLKVLPGTRAHLWCNRIYYCYWLVVNWVCHGRAASRTGFYSCTCFVCFWLPFTSSDSIHPYSLCFLEKVELTNWLRSSRWFSWMASVTVLFWYLLLDHDIRNLQVLGTPTREEIKCMNPNYTEFKFPQIKAHPWHKVICISAAKYYLAHHDHKKL